MADIAASSRRVHSTPFQIPNILSGLVLGFIEVIVALSLASLMFSGTLSSELSRGIGLALITTITHVLFTTFFSSFDGAIAVVQDNPAVLIAVAIAGLESMNLGVVLVPTVITFIMLTALLTGVSLVLIGYFKLGSLIRYIPYPVVGGFLAGSGWLMISGTFRTMTAYSLTAKNLPILLTGDQVVLWLPGILMGLALVAGTRLIRHKLALPVMFMGGLTLFYIVLLLTGTSVDAATSRGLLLGQIGGASAWHPLPLADLIHADWGVVLGQVGNIGTILALTSISLLLNISGLELIMYRDVDLNRELQSTGFANILSALAGGSVGYHSLSQTALRYRLGANGRLPGLIAASICLSVLFFGSAVVAYIPKPLLGGLVIFMGLELIITWGVESRKKLNRIDYAVVLLILVVIAVAGFLVGVGIGLVLMLILFVFNYSRLNMIHLDASGAEVTSHVERSAYHQRALTELGKRIYILEIQGFIFFGTANGVLERVRLRLANKTDSPPEFVLVDFRRVTGLDSSAVFSLTKLEHLAETHDFTLIFTHLSRADQDELLRSGLESSKRIRFFPDLDHGLEWCEDQLLEISKVTKTHFPTTLALQLADNGFKKEDTKRLQVYLKQLQFKPGEYLMRQGSEADEIIFVEIGQVSVYLELENGKRVRLHTHGMGTIVGELGFFLNAPRSASVISDLNTIAYSLKAEAFQSMVEKDPTLANAFHALIVRVLSKRLVASTNVLAALNR